MGIFITICIWIGIIVGSIILIALILNNFDYIKNCFNDNKKPPFESFKIKSKYLIFICLIPGSIIVLGICDLINIEILKIVKFCKKYIEYDKSLEKIFDKSKEK